MAVEGGRMAPSCDHFSSCLQQNDSTQLLSLGCIAVLVTHTLLSTAYLQLLVFFHLD